MLQLSLEWSLLFLTGDFDRERDLERERDAEWWRLLVSGDLLRLLDLLFDFDFDLDRDRLADRLEARRFGGGLRERDLERDWDRERRLTGVRERLRRLALRDLEQQMPQSKDECEANKTLKNRKMQKHSALL